MSTGQTPLYEVERLYGLGRMRQAVAACDAVASATAPGSELTSTLIAKGSLLFDAGDVVGAIDVLTQAMESADRDKDRLSRFHTALSLFAKGAQFQSPDESLPLLSRVRQLASEVGSAAAIGNLHLVVARLEALRGNCGGARQHVEISRQLLATAGAPSRSAVCLVDAALEISTGNIERARKAVAEGLTMAQCAGRNSVLSGCLTNQGCLLLITGETRHAQATLRQAMSLADEMLMVRFSALDALAQVELDENRLDACAALLNESDATLARHRVPARSWYDLAHDLTRAAHHERRGEWESIVEIVDCADQELARRQYKAVRTSLLGIKARALARLGQHERAEQTLSLALRSCPPSAVDPLIVLEASRATCAALRGDPAVARVHFDRAIAGCRAVGHRYHERWIATLRDDLQARPTVAVSGGGTTVGASLLLTDVATILGAGHSIDLMAHRTVSLLQATSLGSRVRVQSESSCDFQPEPSATWQTGPEGTFAIHLRGSDRRVTIEIGDVRSIDDVALIKSVADVVQAATVRSVEGRQSTDELWPSAAPLASDEDAIFRSPRMVELLGVATRLASSNIPVLITGETGTGKEIFARLVHDHSEQRRGPFVPFNCSAVAKDLVESQLFGHRRGAFTGAHEAFGGVIKEAERGTLFLDEIGDLDLAVQPKLLRFLECGEIHPVGDARPRQVKVRLVAATNADLEELMRQGRFRRDLFYRIGVTKIALPPLCERKDEIPALAALFVSRFSRQCGRNGLRLGDDLVAALLLYQWPGNIRELSNEIRRLVALAADGETLRARDLAPDIAREWFLRPSAPTAGTEGPGVFVRLDQTLAQAISELEQHFIDRALQVTGGRVAEAAQVLGLSRKGLFLKRRRRGLLGSSAAETETDA